MKRTISILFVACLALSQFSIAQARESRKERNGAARLPPNLILSEEARRRLEKVWLRSPTFRDQCRRVAQLPQAEIRFDFVVRNSDAHHAITMVSRTEGRMTITMRVFISDRCVEMIGHEFEHVVEQIEGMNLKALAFVPGAGVRRNAEGFYETKRAIEAGRRVFREYRAAKRKEDDQQEPLAAVRK
ncbi:MAG: hypothetical protein AB7U82_15785 [Blastocatellales bacterium]